MEMKISPPVLLTIDITSRCDARCQYCTWWRVDKADPPLTRILRRVHEAAKFGVQAIRLSGGEPLLRTDLPVVIRAIREADLVSMVCTSGRHDVEKLMALVDAGLDVLSISLDTLEPVIFENIRGYPLRPVMENLLAMAELREKRRFEIIISTVLTRWNLGHIRDLLSFAYRHEFLINFTPCIGGETVRHGGMQALLFEKNDRPRIEEAVSQINRAAKGVRRVNSERFLEGIADFLTERKMPRDYVCRAGDRHAILNVGGQWKLCHSMSPIGRGPLADKWRSHEAMAIRHRMRKLECPRCWLSCHADTGKMVVPRFGRDEIYTLL